jgi:hypothetical protein
LKLECVFVCLYKLHMYGGVKFKLIDWGINYILVKNSLTSKIILLKMAP